MCRTTSASSTCAAEAFSRARSCSLRWAPGHVCHSHPQAGIALCRCLLSKSQHPPLLAHTAHSGAIQILRNSGCLHSSASGDANAWPSLGWVVVQEPAQSGAVHAATQTGPPSPSIEPDAAIVDAVVGMGFTENASKRAAVATQVSWPAVLAGLPLLKAPWQMQA